MVYSVRLSTGDIRVLLFVDDVMMMAELEEVLQHVMQVVNDSLEKWELKTIWQTRVIWNGRRQDVSNVKVNCQKLEQVEVMKYLGAMISSGGKMDNEVEQRVGMASKMIRAIWRTVLGGRN